jgi:hypothetical protein
MLRLMRQHRRQRQQPILRRAEAPYIIESHLNSFYFLKEVEGSPLVSGDIIETLSSPYFLQSHRLVLG